MNKYKSLRDNINSSGQNAAGTTKLEKAYYFCNVGGKINNALYYVYLIWEEFFEANLTDNPWVYSTLDEAQVSTKVQTEVKLTRKQQTKVEMLKNIFNKVQTPSSQVSMLSSTNECESKVNKLDELNKLGELIGKHAELLNEDVKVKLTEKLNDSLIKMYNLGP